MTIKEALRNARKDIGGIYGSGTSYFYNVYDHRANAERERQFSSYSLAANARKWETVARAAELLGIAPDSEDFLIHDLMGEERSANAAIPAEKALQILRKYKERQERKVVSEPSDTDGRNGA